MDRKGIRELLAAIPIVLEAAPETRFVLVGGYSGGAEVERCWMDEVLRPWRDRIHSTGWLTPERVAACYRTADVLLVPSWYEPFGMVVLEGMLHAMAIVACSVGGPAEILEHERTAKRRLGVQNAPYAIGLGGYLALPGICGHLT